MVACGPSAIGLSPGIGLGSIVISLVAKVQKKWIDIEVRIIAVNNKTICRIDILC
jgi:hypothetical protein